MNTKFYFEKLRDKDKESDAALALSRYNLPIMAVFQAAHLRKAKFSSANLSNANLSNADLKGTC